MVLDFFEANGSKILFRWQGDLSLEKLRSQRLVVCWNMDFRERDFGLVV